MLNKTAKKIGVLVVEDSPVISMVLEDVLLLAGYKVLARVATGKGLGSVISQHGPDVILLDQHLPDCKGVDLLKEIKTSFPQTIVIMVTLECDPSVEQRARQLGAAAFIQKPFTSEQVTREIERALSRAGRI